MEAGAGVGISAKAAWEIGKRYQEGGLEAALYDAPRPGQKPLLDAEHGQRIIAMVCGPPPAGRARWTVRLIAQEAVKRKLVEHVGPETVRILASEPRPEAVAGKKCGAWRNWMRSTSGAWKTFWRLYEKPLSEEEPVVCIDEKPVVLHEDIVLLCPPGRARRHGATTSTSQDRWIEAS